MVIDETKVSTELKLALSIPYSERKNALDLNEGFYSTYNEWELVIRYFGDIELIARNIPFTYIELINGFAIIRIAQENIIRLSNEPQIIFIEKPKAVYFENNFLERNVFNNIFLNGYNESCFNLVNFDEKGLYGTDVIVVVIDSGIDISHPVFKDNNNNSTIYEIWDQNIDGNPPNNLNIGSVYTNEDINNALKDNDLSIAYDSTGHGTAVSSIIKRIVPKARLIVVKLRENYSQGISRTTSIMLGITYAIYKSIDMRLPAVINLSFGNNYGDHDSNSILEEYIDSVSNVSKISIITGMGNEGAASRHTEFHFGDLAWHQEEFLVSKFELSINIQIWREYIDIIDVFLVTPNGIEIGPFNNYQEMMNYTINDMNIFVLNGYPTPLNRNIETFISIIPTADYLQEGIWKIKFNPKNIVNGKVNIWLPVSASTSSALRFLRPSEFTTMTIPATARNIISVGAYNQNNLTYASFSGRGYTVSNNIKPDLSAPGIDINVASAYGGYKAVSGTSFATPFVSAAAVMLMEYGITNQNDVYLYGEKIKEYLISGAKKLPGPDSIPNEKTGWGVLCISDSIPK